MQDIHGSIVMFHIACGALSLILFWGPCIARKGGLMHKRIGTFYLNTMTLTSVSGVTSSTIVLLFPLLIYPTVPSQFTTSDHFVAYLQGQYTFLLMLSLLVWNNIRHAKQVLTVKSDRARLKGPVYLWLPAMLFFVSVIALYQGLRYGIILTQIFAPIALFNSIGIFRYVYKKDIANREWVIQHIGHIIGSGIGAYTAFFAFGGRTLFENIPLLQITSWVLPSMIGVPVTIWLSRKYTAMFGVKITNS